MAGWQIVQTDKVISASIDGIWIHRFRYAAHLTLRRNGNDKWNVTDSFLIRHKKASGYDFTSTRKNHCGTPAAYRRLHTIIVAQIIEWAEKRGRNKLGTKQKEST